MFLALCYCPCKVKGFPCYINLLTVVSWTSKSDVVLDCDRCCLGNNGVIVSSDGHPASAEINIDKQLCRRTLQTSVDAKHRY